MSVDLVRDQVAALLRVPPTEIGDDDDLLDHGLDSVRVMALVETWRADGAEVGFVELAEQPTVAAWAALIQSARDQGRL